MEDGVWFSVDDVCESGDVNPGSFSSSNLISLQMYGDDGVTEPKSDYVNIAGMLEVFDELEPIPEAEMLQH